jgi:hypothetical protein
VHELGLDLVGSQRRVCSASHVRLPEFPSRAVDEHRTYLAREIPRVLVGWIDPVTDPGRQRQHLLVTDPLLRGEPLVYELGGDLRPLEAKPVVERYLRSPDEIEAAAEAVARQAEGAS